MIFQNKYNFGIIHSYFEKMLQSFDFLSLLMYNFMLDRLVVLQNLSEKIILNKPLLKDQTKKESQPSKSSKDLEDPFFVTQSFQLQRVFHRDISRYCILLLSNTN